MKRRIRSFGTAVAFILFVMFVPGNVFADNLFLPEIEKAVDQAIPAWIAGDTKVLTAAMEKLTRNETYLLAIGQSKKDRSYLARVPKTLNHNLNSIGAYLFLIRKEKKGIMLWPRFFFQGQRFEFYEKGER